MILPLCCLLWHLATPAWAQETLSLKECREMALKYNKEMAASVKQTESARYTAKSYKGYRICQSCHQKIFCGGGSENLRAWH